MSFRVINIRVVLKHNDYRRCAFKGKNDKDEVAVKRQILFYGNSIE